MFYKSAIKQRTVRVKTLELAVSKCSALDTPPIFMGPRAIDQLSVGDDVEEHLVRRLESSDPGSESESEPESNHSADPDDASDTESVVALGELTQITEADMYTSKW